MERKTTEELLKEVNNRINKGYAKREYKEEALSYAFSRLMFENPEQAKSFNTYLQEEHCQFIERTGCVDSNKGYQIYDFKLIIEKDIDNFN